MSRSNTFNPGQRIELTPRQEDVVRLIAGGLTNSEIADRLGVTLDGVKWHVREILGKFGVESREQAAEMWKQENTVGRRVRNWGAGLWAATGVRWAGGLAVAGSAAAVGAGIAFGLSRAEPELATPSKSQSIVVEQPAVADGLTLQVQGAETDSNVGTVSLWLYGRPDLGQFSSEPVDPSAIRISDEFGNAYAVRSVSVDPHNVRQLSVAFDPMLLAARSLRVEIQEARFTDTLNESFRPSGPLLLPTSTVAGPWIVEITDVRRLASSLATVDPAPRPFGPATIVLDSARQTPGGTVLTLKLSGMPTRLGLSYVPEFQLLDANNRDAGQLHATWGLGQVEDGMEVWFDRTSGPVTFRVSPVPRSLIQVADVANMVASGSTNRSETETRGIALEMEAARAEFEAIIANQPPATWAFTLP